MGGIQWLIDFVHRRANSKRGAQLGIAGLVAAVDVATANNTVAIVMTGSIAKDISQEYHIDPRRSASLLDIFASVMQGILPYGAQLLYASAGTGSLPSRSCPTCSTAILWRCVPWSSSSSGQTGSGSDP